MKRLIFIFFSLNLLDLLITLLALSHGLFEYNPIMFYLFKVHIWVFIGLKLATPVIVLFFFYKNYVKLENFQKEHYILALYFINIIYFLTFISNLIILHLP